MNKLIILPGWGGNKETWKEFAELASKEFEVQIIELPCFGDEPCPNTVWGVEDYVEFVKQRVCHPESLPQQGEGSLFDGSTNKLDDPGVNMLKRDSSPSAQNDEVILLGHSFGGQVATVLASKYPELIDKLILSAPAVFRPKKTLKRIILGSIAKLGKIFFKVPIVEKYRNTIRNGFHCLIGARDYNKASGIQTEIFKKAIRQDVGEDATKILVPTLIIWGTLDHYLPVSDAYKLNKLIKNSKLEIIKGGKHGLHLQMPEKLLEIINKFVN